MRRVLLLSALLAMPMSMAAERPADADELLFLGEFVALETGLRPADLGHAGEQIAWGDLNETQQQILGEAASGWDQLDAERQWWLVLGALRWADLPGRKRREVDEHLRAWNRLTVAQQNQIEENLRRFSALDEAERRSLRERYRDFSNLSPGQQRRLRDAFEGMSEDERARLRERMLRQNQDPPPSDGEDG